MRQIYYVSKLVNMFSDHLESCQTLRKVSRLSKHFPDDPKTSKPSGKFLNHPEGSRWSESFQIIRKVSRSFGKFPNHPESFQIIRKVSRSSRKFPDHPESFQTIKKYVHFCMFLMMDLVAMRKKLSGRAKTFGLVMPPWDMGFSGSAFLGARYLMLGAKF